MGMTIEEARAALGKERKYALHENKQAFDIAINTMRKYQQLQADYENRLKADMVVMLTELQLEIEYKEQYYQGKFLEQRNAVHDAAMGGRMFGCGECKDLVQQKINALKAEEGEKDDKREIIQGPKRTTEMDRV